MMLGDQANISHFSIGPKWCVLCLSGRVQINFNIIAFKHFSFNPYSIVGGGAITRNLTHTVSKQQFRLSS